MTGGKLTVVASTAALVLSAAACRSDEQPRLTVEETSSLFDAPLHIRVDGAHSGEHLVLGAHATDHDGVAWSSSATFVADRSGAVDVASTAPIAGSYTVPSPTGLLWSMAPPGSTSYFFEPAGDATTYTLTLTVADKTVTEARFTRRWRSPDVTSRDLTVAAEGFWGTMYSPRVNGPARPAVLVFGGSEGGLRVGEEATALATHGYPALALAYFGGPGLPATLTEVPLEYFARALRWLATQPGVDPNRIAVYGVSRGSEAALLLGVHYPQLVHAVLALVPSSVVFGALPDTTRSAWTWRGAAVPFARWAEAFAGPDDLEASSAAIPVERINGPLFLLCGEADYLWPSCRYVDAIVDRLDAHATLHVPAVVQEPRAGHSVGAPVPNGAVSSGFVDTARYGRLALGGTQQDDALGRLDAWPKLLAFLAGL